MALNILFVLMCR